MKTRLSILLLSLALLGGCAATSAGAQYHSPEYQAREVLSQPVIQAKDALLSEEAIRMLLSHRIVLPAKAKLAVVDLGHESIGGGGYYRANSAEFLQLKKEKLEAIEAPLEATGRFTEITHVPRLLHGGYTSLVRLREAAALMQADLLLVYQSRSQLVYDFNLFSKDEVRAHGSIEVLVIDVTSGAVPMADTFEAFHLEKGKKEDVDDFELKKRADRAVTFATLEAAVAGISDFFARRAPATPAEADAG
ncbi:MAG: hypothetical protein P1V51_11270 [Deltaproteobacteria bacterium]|nr:hypothetical protein [Deltaproteobacteria bacterium]